MLHVGQLLNVHAEELFTSDGYFLCLLHSNELLTGATFHKTAHIIGFLPRILLQHYLWLVIFLSCIASQGKLPLFFNKSTMAGCNMLLCKYFAWGETGELRFHAGAAWEKGDESVQEKVKCSLVKMITCLFFLQVGTKKCLSWRLCCLDPLVEQFLLFALLAASYTATKAQTPSSSRQPP